MIAKYNGSKHTFNDNDNIDIRRPFESVQLSYKSISRKWPLLLALLGMMMFSFDGYSQAGKVPPFQIVMPNGNLFKAENLPMGKPIVIVYFSPECEDCQQMTEDLINYEGELNKASIVMITYLSLEEVIQFAKKFALDKYSHIYIGTERDSFFVGRYYNVGQLPFMALYSKNGDLIKVYKEINIPDLSLQLKRL